MTTQAGRTLAVEHLRAKVREFGMPHSPEGWMMLVEAALSLPDPENARLVEERGRLEEVARRSRFVYDQWVLGNVTRQNGMDDLRKALDDAGF